MCAFVCAAGRFTLIRSVSRFSLVCWGMFWSCALAAGALGAPGVETAYPPAKQAAEGEDLSGLPQFITRDFIDIGQIACVSLFRSSVGHDYSWASSEECRSMKHYFEPRAGVDETGLILFAPASGIAVRIRDEWIGQQVEIIPDAAPEFTLHIFHVLLDPSIIAGIRVRAGQPIGLFSGVTRAADIAVRGPDDFHSYFEVMTPEVFQGYVDRGAASIQQFILTKEQRDGDPLTCEGEQFLTEGVLPQWFFFESSAEGEGSEGGPPVFHTADQNGDHRIGLMELLRGIQFFNSGGYHCASLPEETEDGYAPGSGAEADCRAHDSDYAPHDWVISLSELLRLIQLRNSGGYHACPEQGSEDGFCGGLF